MDSLIEDYKREQQILDDEERDLWLRNMRELQEEAQQFEEEELARNLGKP